MGGALGDEETLDQRGEWSRLALDAAPNAIIMVDEARTIVLVSRGAEVMFGYTRDELVGQPLELLIPERYRARHPSLVEGFLAEPRARAISAGGELYGRCRDGSEIPVEIGLNPIATPRGNFTLASIIDISERHRAEARFQMVVEAAPNAMLMIDRRRRIALINRATEELFGYARAELIGQPVEVLVPPRLRDRHQDFVESFFAAPQKREMGAGRELHGQHRDGHEIQIEIGLNPIETREGMFTLASIIDITERKRRDLELERSNAELQQFAYVASHDLQEPLRMVANYTELLGQRYRGQLDARADKYIHYATDGAKRMQRLVADLLAYSRVGSQGKRLAPVSAAAVVDQVLQSIQSSLAESGAIVERGPLPVVLADELQLHQLFQNLIGNAIKFRAEAPPRVAIAAVASGHRWTFSVADNGIGIDMQYADRIYQMFQRLHAVGAYPGSGIGLALAKRIVERHDGKLWFESQLGVGTTFYFTLRAVPRGGP